jgi:gas vesicle protein
MKLGLGTLLVGTTALAGGVIAGFLLAPKSGKENRNWLKSQSGQTKNWLEHTSRKLRDDGEQRIDRLSKGIKRSLKDSLPDLYEATSELSFSEEEEIRELTEK